MRISALVLAIPTAALIAGCGSGKTKTVTVAPTEATTTATTTTTAAAPDPCETKGITTAERKVGRCIDDDGTTHIVATLGSAIKLKDYDVTVLKKYTAKTVDGGDANKSVRAEGRFVIFRMKIKNRSKRPVGWFSGVGATALRIGDVIYTADDNLAAYNKAYTLTGDPGLEGSTEVQAGRSKDAWVAFDVPEPKVALLTKQGAELLIVDYEGSANGYNAESETADEQGIVPLWK